MSTSQNFTGLSKFQIDILKIGYFTEQSAKCREKLVCKYRTAHEMQNSSHDFTELGDVINI